MPSVPGLNGAGGFRQPDLHPMLLQPREKLIQLVIEECPFVLTDHDRVEGAFRPADRRQQFGRLRALWPWHLPGHPGVEELPHDRAVPLNEILGHLPLPASRGEPVLKPFGGRPSVEGEPQARRGFDGSGAARSGGLGCRSMLRGAGRFG